MPRLSRQGDALVNTSGLVCASGTKIVSWDMPDVDISHRYIISCTLRSALRENNGLLQERLAWEWSAGVGFSRGQQTFFCETPYSKYFRFLVLTFLVVVTQLCHCSVTAALDNS